MFVEAFPEFVNRCAGGFSTDVEQDTDIRVDERAEGVEEPSMGVQFLLVLLLEAEDDLDWTRGLSNLPLGCDSNTTGILEDVGLDIFSTNGILRNTILIRPHQSQDLERSLVDFSSSVGNDADHDFLPTRRTPGVGSRTSTKMCNILDDGVHRLAKEDFVFVIHSHDDEQFSLSPHEVWSKIILGANELVRIDGASSVSHMCMFFSGFASRDNTLGYGHVQYQISLTEFDLSDGSTFH